MPPPPPPLQQPHPSPPQQPPTTFLSTVLNPTNSPGPTTTPPRKPPSAPPIGQPNKSAFTQTQQSLQSRSKPFASRSSIRAGEAFESSVRRANAAEILSSVEVLGWFAGSREESIPQTRRYLQNILLGLDQPDNSNTSGGGNRDPRATDGDIWREEYEVRPEERVGFGVSPARLGVGGASAAGGSGSGGAGGSGSPARGSKGKEKRRG